MTAMGQRLSSDAIKIATFHAETVMGNPEDFKKRNDAERHV